MRLVSFVDEVLQVLCSMYNSGCWRSFDTGTFIRFLTVLFAEMQIWVKSGAASTNFDKQQASSDGLDRLACNGG